MIYKLPFSEEYVISSRRVWIPGVYESKRAAKYAFRFSDEDLANLRDSTGGKTITFKQLQDLAKSKKNHE